MNKLIVVIMGPGKKHFAEMCLDSVKDADKILYWTSGLELSIEEKQEWDKKEIEIFFNEWDESDPATNGKCRQKYLEHLKKNYPDDWCLVLDEDEILDDNGINKIKEFIKKVKPGIYNVKMRHFIGDIGHEDAMVPVHVVPGRLFKISEAIRYPEHSHPIIEGELMGACLDTTIWHLGHLPVEYMDYILKRYKQHANDSKIHPPNFLKQWKMSHLFGIYPTRQINPVELPKQILDRYELNRDEFYFADRNLELKHFIDAIHWKEFFGKGETVDFLEFGCGKGPRVFALEKIGCVVNGIELSSHAVINALSGYVNQGDVLDCDIDTARTVIAFDLFEHINYKDLNTAINNTIKHSQKYLLISVPVLGDPNLELDPTHIIKEDKEWWIKQFTDKGLKLIPTPEHFLYKEQLMIFEK